MNETPLPNSYWPTRLRSWLRSRRSPVLIRLFPVCSSTAAGKRKWATVQGRVAGMLERPHSAKDSPGRSPSCLQTPRSCPPAGLSMTSSRPRRWARRRPPLNRACSKSTWQHFSLISIMSCRGAGQRGRRCARFKIKTRTQSAGRPGCCATWCSSCSSGPSGWLPPSSAGRATTSASVGWEKEREKKTHPCEK